MGPDIQTEILPNIGEMDEIQDQFYSRLKQTNGNAMKTEEGVLLEKELNAIKIKIDSPGLKNITNKDTSVLIGGCKKLSNIGEYKDIQYSLFEKGKTVKDDQSVPVTYSDVSEQDHSDEEYKTQLSGTVSETCARYKCDVCDRICSTFGNLERHMYTHTKEKPFQCTLCAKGFIRKKRLTEHVNSAHRDLKPYSCELCTRTFSMKHNLKAHMNYHSTKYRYACLLCDKQYKYRGDISKHMKRVHNESLSFGKNAVELDEIVDCQFKSAKRESAQFGRSHPTNKAENSSHAFLQRHACLHNNTSPFTCSWCDESFLSIISLNVHIESVHVRLKPFECDECEKSFATTQRLEEHKQIHLSFQIFHCTACRKQYKTKSNLKKHMKRMHAKNSQAFIFAETEQIHNEMSDRTEHVCSDDASLSLKEMKVDETDVFSELPINTMEDQQIERSKQCSNHFDSTSAETADVSEQYSPFIRNKMLQSQETSVQQHKKPHFDSPSRDNKIRNEKHKLENKHNKKSGASSVSKDLNLQKHLSDVMNKSRSRCNKGNYGSKVFKQKKQAFYKCESCDRSFSSQGNLKTHSLLHSKSKPYNCSLCSQGFTRKDRLTVHIYSVHTGYRPHICHVCQKAFTTKENLRNHKFCHSLQRLFVCTYCNKDFKAKSNLGKHVKRNHCK